MRSFVVTFLLVGCGTVGGGSSPDAPGGGDGGGGDGGADGPPGAMVTLDVSVDGTGAGMIVSEPAGVSCPGTCAADFPSGTAVTLRATPNGGSSFSGFLAPCPGLLPCELALDANTSVRAGFNLSGEFRAVRALASATGPVIAHAAAFDAMGNVYAVGFFAGTLTVAGSSISNPNAPPDVNVFVAKLALPDLSVVWLKQYGSASGNDNAFAVAVGPAGNPVVGGNFFGTVDFGGAPFVRTATSSNDGFVLALNDDGSTRWVRHIPGSGTETVSALTVGPGGNVVAGGSFTGSVDVGSGTLGTRGSADLFVAEYAAADGAFHWETHAGTPGSDIANGLAMLGTDVIATGVFGDGAENLSLSADGFTITRIGSLDIWAARLMGTNGQTVWGRAMGGSLEDFGTGIAADSQGNVYVTGSFTGTASFGNPSMTLTAAAQDPFLVKLMGGDGALVWQRRWGGSSFDKGQAVGVDPLGHVSVTGRMSGTSTIGDTTVITQGEDGYALKLDGDNRQIFGIQVGGAMSDVGRGLAVGPFGQVVVVGRYNGAWATPPLPAPADPGNDGFIVLYGP
jgi:hypothetical protein